MGDKQIYFSLVTGILVAAIGGAVSLISESGWGLVTIGLALSVLAVIGRAMASKADVSGSEYTVCSIEDIKTKSAKAEQDSEVRHAA